ncbi:MAG: flavin reductase family protein [Bacteroidales bacterium]
MKEQWKPGTMIYPLPAVLVGCGNTPDNYNLITVAWVGTLCTNPPLCYISLRPERHSYHLIKEYGEFVINLTTAAMAKATDWCGVRSGKDYKKFKETGLHYQAASIIQAPSIQESPLSIECKVKQIMELGSHHAFISEVVQVLADPQYLNTETGKLELEKAHLLTYSHGEYFEIGKSLGHFGWSVRKKDKTQKNKVFRNIQNKNKPN